MITSQQAKSACLEFGISKNKIAKDTGLSCPYLSNFELDKYDPNDGVQRNVKGLLYQRGNYF